MELKIYNQADELKLTVSPNTSSTVTEEVMGECAVSVGFTHTEFEMLDVNDYIDIEGIRYRIMSQYRPKQKNTQTYEYSVKFYAPIHQAENTLMLFTPDNEMTSEFSYDGGPREHLQLWIDNMNRIAGVNVWKIGTVITAENKVIEYKNVKCWDAAFGSNGIAAAFDTEMWADGYYINLCKAERGERVDLGYLQGLTSLQQEENGEVKFFTRLFPLGSTRNIDASKYGHARLQLPGGVQFVDKNVDIYGVKEEFEEEAFSEIYPKYIGTVQSVRTENLTNTEGRDYTVYYIKDAAIPFNPNDYEIAEYTKMIAFQTGELAGRGDDDGNFQANWHEDTKEWEIINTYPDDETQIPGGLIVPKPGDTYIPWNFRMPDEYNTLAEQEYLEAVNDYLNEYSFDTNKYSGQTDRNHIENNNIKLMIGLNVRLQSETYFAGGYKDTRITKVVRQLNDLYQATVTCTDKIGEGWKKSVDNSINSLKYEVAKSLEQTIINIIKSTDRNTASDNNVFSALASLLKFHRKDQSDSNPYLQTFLKGIQLGKYMPGLLGSGGTVNVDENGDTHAEFDYLTIRKTAMFFELMVQQAKYVGGQIIVSPASMTVSEVEETDSTYKCFFENTDGNKTLRNLFSVGAQARRQTFNLTEQAYYWRLVTAVGDNYIELSKTDADEGSTIPQAGDEIVQLGHRTDVTMQSAIVISAFGTGSPSIVFYQGIDSYDLTGKDIKSDYYDVSTGRFKSVEYGDKYTGASDKSTFFEYTQDGGAHVNGKFTVQSGSTGVGNFSDLPLELQKAIQIGAENLLMNTSFAGDYEPLTLSADTKLKSDTDLYSPKLIGWGGNATVVEDEEATSGYAAQLGTIAQGTLLIMGENYVISYKAKGTSVRLEIGNVVINQNLSSTYKRYSHVFTAGEGTIVTISGACTICDIKLERGTIATDWCPSVNDSSKDKEGFKALFDIQAALKGKTQFYGGLGLTTMIQLGVWENDILTKINAGISGIWNNDQDVAYWAGGTYEEAIATVNKIINGETPTEDEWKDLAKFVVTHGGDVFIRGYIYALGGVFRGVVYATGGEFNGKITTSIDGKRIVIDPETSSFKMYDKYNNECVKIMFSDGEPSYSSIVLTEYGGVNNDIPIFNSVISGRACFWTSQGGDSVLLSTDEVRVANGTVLARLTKNGLLVDDGTNDTQYTSSGVVQSGGVEGKTEKVFLYSDDSGFKTYMMFKNGLYTGLKIE